MIRELKLDIIYVLRLVSQNGTRDSQNSTRDPKCPTCETRQ